MAQPPGVSRSTPPVDDADSIQRFVDAMVRKNLTAFTNSKPSLPVKTKIASQRISSATDGSVAKSSWSDVGKGTTTELTTNNHKDDVMMQMDNVVMQMDIAKSQIPTPSTKTKDVGWSKAVLPLPPAEPAMLDAPMLTPTATAAQKQMPALLNNAHPLTNKTLTSPLISGLRAPPPTPDAAPMTDIKQIIVDAFEDLHVGSPPHFTLGASRHVPPRQKSKDKSKENVQPFDSKDDMPRFFSPSKILSPEEKQQRDESFQRVLALTSPGLANVKENKTAAAMDRPNMEKDILGSRWAEKRGELSERRKSGSAAVPIVDPKIKAHTPPASNAASSFFINPSQPGSAVAEPPSTFRSAPAVKSLLIMARPTVPAPSIAANAATPLAEISQYWPATKEEPSALPIAAADAPVSAPAEASNTSSGFKTFEASSEPNETNLFFSSWPKLTGRDAPRTLPPISSFLRKRLADLQILAARIRRVELVNLPRDSSAQFVQSLVFGGPLELLNVGSSSASVVFLHAEDCIKYYDSTSNGLVYKMDGGKESVCFVELAKDVDVVGGLLRGSIEYGVTRCVRGIGVEEEWGLPALFKMAGRKGRKVEHVVDGVSAGGVSGSPN